MTTQECPAPHCFMSARLVPARDHSHAKGRGEPVALKEGENLVGRDRKSAAVWIDDKRCSRKQAVLTWTKEGAGSLEITVSGTNPCFLCGKEGGKPTPLTKKEGSTALRHGDTICLLALEFPFVVELTGSEDDEDDFSSPVPFFDAYSPAINKKREIFK